ncbi:SdpI family protein [Aquirufa rosea]|uniref:DUF1648 domain-containing protein n=1 Tax=Aquirufa rosea TaxID=2509241 RepID=A0A4Q1BY99_9BACT|nr:DUF1648 domain-containing protein [Aquirufa rosea]RXK47692.1 DUF1648 domain-containing protein [Aquirufa rosea]
MSIDHFFSRVWRIISLVGFGVSLLFIYRGLPDPTAVHFGETGRGDGFLPKEEVFYLTAGIITLINMLALLLIKNIQKIPAAQFLSLFSAFQKKGPENIKAIVGHWLHMLPALINTYMILVLRALLLLNDERTYNQDFSYYPSLGIVLLLLWLIYLPVRLFSLADESEN